MVSLPTVSAHLWHNDSTVLFGLVAGTKAQWMDKASKRTIEEHLHPTAGRRFLEDEDYDHHGQCSAEEPTYSCTMLWKCHCTGDFSNAQDTCSMASSRNPELLEQLCEPTKWARAC